MKEDIVKLKRCIFSAQVCWSNLFTRKATVTMPAKVTIKVYYKANGDSDSDGVQDLFYPSTVT